MHVEIKIRLILVHKSYHQSYRLQGAERRGSLANEIISSKTTFFISTLCLCYVFVYVSAICIFDVAGLYSILLYDHAWIHHVARTLMWLESLHR